MKTTVIYFRQIYSSGKRRIRTAALVVTGLLLFLPLAHAQVSPAVREFRLHMFEPAVSVLANRTFELMFDTARVDAGDGAWGLPRDPQALDFSYAFDGVRLDAEGFAGRTFTNALLILKHGRIVHETYLNRATAQTHFNSYSMGKSINSILTGIAIADGSLPSVDAPILDYMPELKGTAYDGLTLKNLLQMRTGVEWDDNFFAPGPGRDAHVGAFVDNEIRYVSAAEKILERARPPGQAFNYNSIEARIGSINTHSVEFQGYPVIVRDGVCLEMAKQLLDFDAAVVLEK